MSGVGVGVLDITGAPARVASFVTQQCRRSRQGLHISAVPVDEHQPPRPARSRPAELYEQKPQRGGADRYRPGKTLVFAAGAVADRWSKRPSRIMIGFRQPLSNLASDG